MPSFYLCSPVEVCTFITLVNYKLTTTSVLGVWRKMHVAIRSFKGLLYKSTSLSSKLSEENSQGWYSGGSSVRPRPYINLCNNYQMCHMLNNHVSSLTRVLRIPTSSLTACIIATIMCKKSWSSKKKTNAICNRWGMHACLLCVSVWDTNRKWKQNNHTEQKPTLLDTSITDKNCFLSSSKKAVVQLSGEGK